MLAKSPNQNCRGREGGTHGIGAAAHQNGAVQGVKGVIGLNNRFRKKLPPDRIQTCIQFVVLGLKYSDLPDAAVPG